MLDRVDKYMSKKKLGIYNLPPDDEALSEDEEEHIRVEEKKKLWTRPHDKRKHQLKGIFVTKAYKQKQAERANSTGGSHQQEDKKVVKLRVREQNLDLITERVVDSPELFSPSKLKSKLIEDSQLPKIYRSDP